MEPALNNPYRPPPKAPAEHVQFVDPRERSKEPAIAEFEAGPAGARIVFLRDELRCERDGKPDVVISREAFARHCALSAGMLNVISIREPERIGLPFRPTARAAMRRWIEPVLTQVIANSLAQTFRAAMPFGAMMVLFSLPLLTSRVDWLGLTWAGTWFGLGLLTRVVKHRALYLGDAFVWGVLALRNVVNIGATRTWALSVCVAIVCVLSAIGSVRSFLFFGPPPRETADSA